MSRSRRLSLLVFCVCTLGCLVACETVPAGPSLTGVSFTALAKKATIGDPTVCCCHATGNITNNNSVPVHVTITIAALDSRNVQLGRAPAFIRDLQPGSTRAVEASGFVFPCVTIARFDYELNVSSLGMSPDE
jgi:hypothetical protein